MATFISNQSGLWSAASTWLTAAAGTLTPTAPAGSAPQSGGGDKFIIRGGHVVTYDVVGIWGDETSTYITGNTLTTMGSTNAIVLSAGTLKASRTTNTELTARGNITIGVSGSFDWGTTSDPLTTNANITLHYMPQLSALSASQGAAGLYLMGGGNADNQPVYNSISINGKPKLRNTALSVSAANGSSTITVVSATGWEVGDRLCIATDLIVNRGSTTIGVLSSTTIQSMTGNSITISPALNTSRSAGTCVSNFTSNVNIKTFNPLYGSYGLYLFPNSVATIDINNVYIGSGVGAGITAPVGWMTYSYTGSRAAAAQTGTPIGNISINSTYCQTSPFKLKGVVFDNLLTHTQHYGLYVTGKFSETITWEDCACFVTNSNGFFAQTNTQATTYFKNCNCYNSTYGCLLGGSVPNSVTLDNCNYDASVSIANALNGLNLNVINSKLRSSGYLTGLDAIQKGTIKNSNIYHTSSTGAILQNNVNASGSLIFSNCNFFNGTVALSAVTKTATGMISKTSQTAEFGLYQVNGNLFDYRRLNYYHYSQTDLVNRKRGITSYRIKPEIANTQFYNYFVTPGVIDTPQRIKGSLRFDANYGTSFPPSISFTGAGVDTTFTCGPTANVWQDFDVILAPTTTDDITIKITCQSSNINGYVWLDGMPVFPYIQNVRHYGYVFDNNIFRTTNIHNTLSSESAVAALTGVTTLDYLYDVATYWSVTNPALTSYVDVVNIDGTYLDFGDKNIVVDASASTTFAYNSAANIITLKSGVLSGGKLFDTIISQGSLSTINSAQVAKSVLIRTSNIDSELVYNGADNIVLYPTITDAQNSTNPGPSANNGVLRFLYGQTSQGVVLSGDAYIRWTAGTYSDLYTGTIVKGHNELGDLSNQAGLAIAINNMNIINQGVQKTSLLVPHSASTATPTGLTVQIQTLINDQQVVNEGVKKASKLIPHTINL